MSLMNGKGLVGALVVVLAAVFAGSLSAQLTAIVPSGTDTQSTPAPPYASGWPMSTWWWNQRLEAIYTVADLNAAGITPGAMINSVSLRCAAIPGKQVENFRVRIGHTSNTQVNAYTPSTGLTLVFGPQTFQTTAYTVGGWHTYQFTAPFMWNGTQNLVVDFTTTGTSYVNGGGCYVRAAGTSRARAGYQDSGGVYPHDNISYQGVSNDVPTLQLNYSPGTVFISTPNPLPDGIDGLNYNTTIQTVSGTSPYTWTVGTGLPSGVVATPSGSSLVLSGTPAAKGNYQFSVSVTDGSSNTSQKNFDLEIRGPDYEALEGSLAGTRFYSNDPATAPSIRDLGQVTVGQNKSINIVIRNNSASTISVPTGSPGTYSKSGANPGNFVVTTQPSMPLAAGASTTLSVNFNTSYTTGGTGVYTCTIELYHDAPVGPGVTASPFLVNLRAEAIQPAAKLEVRESGTAPLIPHNDPATGTNRDFGSVNVGSSSAPLTIAVTNSGNIDLAITGIQMDAYGDWSQFQVDTTGWTFTQQLAPSQTMTFEITFEPTSAGVKNARVVIAHGDTSQGAGYPYYYIPVMGTGVSTAPTLVVNDGGGAIAHDAAAAGTNRDFGNVVVGSTSAPLTITINNPGGSPLSVQNVALGGPDAGQFALNLAGFTPPIPAGGSDTFEVTFSPTSVGQKSAWVEFTHDDTTVTSPFRINLTGNGVLNAPIASVHIGSAGGPALTNPAPATGVLNFGQQNVAGGPTAAVTIYVENTGTAALTLSAPTVNPAGEFLVQNAGGFAVTLNPGAAGVTFQIVFDPTSVGVKNAAVEFVHNDATTGSPFVINVTGEGVAPVIEVREGTTTGPTVASGAAASLGGGRDCGSIDVGAGATSPITIVIMNTGTLNLTPGTPTLSGVNAGDFSLNTAGFGGAITPGSSASFAVSFDPSLGGMKDAQIELTHDDTTQPNPYIIPIRGTAVDASGVQITTGSLPSGSSGVNYGPVNLQAIQGTAPYVWSLYGGTLPAGLTLDPTGLIGGVPTGLGGTSNVTIRVTDQSGATDEQLYSISIAGSLTGRGLAKSSGCSAGSGHGSGLAAALLALLAVVALGVRFRRLCS